MVDNLGQFLASVGTFPGDTPARNTPRVEGSAPRGGSPESLGAFIATLGVPSPAPTPDLQGEAFETPASSRGLIDEFVSGFESGISRTGTDIVSLGAAGAQLFGAEETAQELAELAAGRISEDARLRPRAVASVEDIQSGGDFALWASRTLGEQVPTIATIILGGGIGGLVGKLVGRGAMTVAQGTATIARFQRVGSGIGAVATASGIETGASAQEQYEAVGEINPGLAFGAGIAKGSLEAIVPAALGARFGLTPDLSVGLLGSITSAFNRVVPKFVATAGAGAAAEALTESLQESIDIAVRGYVDDNFDALGPEASSRLLNAAAAGGFIGLLFGGLLGGGTRRQAQQEQLAAQGIASPDTGVDSPNVDASETAPDVTTDDSATASQVRVSDQIAFITPGQDPQSGLIFRTPSSAQQVQAFGDPSQQAVRVDRSRVGVQDMSAELSAIPSVIEANDPRITAAPDGTLDTVRQAVELRRVAVQEALTGQGEAVIAGQGGSSALQQAESLYNQAVEAGFRYEPAPDAGFILARPPVAQELIQTEVVAQQASPVFTGTQEIVPTYMPTDTEFQISGDGQNLRFLSPEARIAAKSFKAPPTFEHRARAFEVDLTQLDPAGFVSVDPQAVVRSDLGDQVGGMNEAEFVDALEVSDKFYLTETARPAEILQALKQLTTGISTTERTASLGRAMAAGFRINARPNETHLAHLAEGEFPSQAIISEVPALPLEKRALDVRFPASPEAVFHGLNKVDGTEYSLQDHKPGTVVIMESSEGRNPAATRKLRQIAKFYEIALKRTGNKDFKLVLFDKAVRGSPDLRMGSNTKGVYFAISKTHGAIGLSVSQEIQRAKDRLQSTPDGVLMTAVHEFGHLISYSSYVNAAPETQARLVSAYNRSLVKAAFGGREALNAEFFSPGREYNLMDTENINLLSRRDYYISFDEWFAENVSKYVINFKQEALDPLERMFKAIAKKVRDLYKQIFPDREFAPAPEMEAWLDDLRLQREDKQRTGNSYVEMASNILKQESSEINKGLLNEELGNVKAPPRSVEGGNLKKAFKNMGESNQQTDRIVAFQDYFNQLAKWGFNIFQLSDKNKHIGPLQRYREILNQWWVFKMSWVNRADERVKDWNAIGAGEAEKLSAFIFDVESMSYLTDKERADGVSRWPTQDELSRLVTNHKLSAESFTLYEKIRGDFSAVLGQLEKTAERDIRSTFSNRITQDLEISQLRQEFKNLRDKPYFPHARFGRYSVVVRGKKNATLYMEQFDTEKAARRASVEIAKQFPEGNVRLDAIPEEVQTFQGLPPSLLKSIRGKLQLTEQQKIWLDRLIVDMAPSKSFRKSLAKRDNVAGFSMDTKRAYASYFFHASNYLARIEYFDRLQNQINEIGEQIRGSGEAGVITDVVKRRQIASFMQDHFNGIMNPGPDWASLRSVAFQWWLGFSPASAFINFTQIPMVAWPYLSARFGDVGAADALRKSVFSLQNLYKNRVNQDPLEAAAIDRGIREGFLDESQATELANTAEGSNLQRLLPGNQAQRLLQMTAHWSGWMFQQSEKINRRVVFRAAYALAKDNPGASYLTELRQSEKLSYSNLIADGVNDAEAVAFLAGKDAVNRTQFEYAQHARPRFMRGRKGTILTFFMFTQNMLWFAAHSPGRTRYMMMLLFMAGLMGLPGAEDLNAVLKFASRKLLGKQFDLEKETREFVLSLTNDASLTDMILHGTARKGWGLASAGDMLGIPIPEIDLSANVSMGQIVPGIGALGPSTGTFEQRFSEGVTDAAGASFGIGINMLKFLSDDSLPWHDRKRWERAMPRAMKNLSKAARYSQEGRERTRTGATVLEFDATDPDHLSEIAAQALGFTPARLSREWNVRTAQREAAGYWQARKTMLMMQFDHASVMGDRVAARDVKIAIRRYNQEVPFGSLRITARQLSNSRRERERRRRLSEAGLPQSRREIPLYRSISELYPSNDEPTVEDVSTFGN